MWGGGSYRAWRHTGRMTRDPSMRMSNRAEVGFGMVGSIAIIFLIMIIAIIIF